LEDRTAFSEAALRLRAAFRYDAETTRRYVERGWWIDDNTLTRWLERHERERPDAPAIILGDRTVSWRALARRVACFAEGLRALGVKRGEVVAVQLPNVPEFLVAFLAISRLGAVMATIHMPYRGAEIETLLRHSRAVAAICLAQGKDWSPPQAFSEVVDTVITLGPRVGRSHAFSDLEANAPIARDVPGPQAADPFLLLYTSGTTAAPKGVPLNYHTMLSNARLGVPEHRLTAADRILSAAPLTHLFGLYALHCAWACGAASVLLPVFTPPDMAAVIERDKPTALWTGPAHIAAARAMGLFDRHDWSSLRLSIMSGSACPPELVRDFARRLPNCATTQLWGMSELQAGLYTRPGDPLEVHATSAGRPSPGTEIRIAGPDDAPLAAGEEGELQVRGCLLFPGYYDNDEANRDAFTRDGFFRTGDLARQDASGNVTISGRSKDIINRGGIKFNPRDVEDLLATHPKVLMAAVVPMPDPVLGERACCFAQLRPGVDSLVLEEITNYLIEKNIAKIKLPERLVVIAEMPLTPTRKVIKGKLRIPD
jgi:acyl-CoA synthetase (AMP-forming)/AMP-acid ligase II